MRKNELLFQNFNAYLHQIVKIQENMVDKNKYKIATMSYTTISVIVFLSSKRVCNFKEITKSLKIPKSTLTCVIRKLVKQGYVTIEVDEQDHRYHNVSLTEKGNQLQIEHDEYERELFTIVTGNLNLEEKETLISLLIKGLK